MPARALASSATTYAEWRARVSRAQACRPLAIAQFDLHLSMQPLAAKTLAAYYDAHASNALLTSEWEEFDE
jgi:hypothetical protein